ncbi:hypothetical protein BC827DRAFT_1210657 [Russula dissimulans]|nr:hypothetical protein BC827DRAFT_1210657 [Russula dissimulans]
MMTTTTSLALARAGEIQHPPESRGQKGVGVGVGVGTASCRGRSAAPRRSLRFRHPSHQGQTGREKKKLAPIQIPIAARKLEKKETIGRWRQRWCNGGAIPVRTRTKGLTDPSYFHFHIRPSPRTYIKHCRALDGMSPCEGRWRGRRKSCV